MPAKRIDGKETAEFVRNELKSKVEALSSGGKTPGLAVVLVGNNPASEVYVRSKGKAAEKAGIRAITERYADDISEEKLLSVIDRLNNDPEWNGILVQLPLPGHIDEQKVIEAIRPEKDVDCFHPFNVGRLVIGMSVFDPCTPAGIVELLHRYQIDPAGQHVVILGRSNIVGKPLANLLVQKAKGANAIVTVAHSRAKDIAALTREADILVAAIGVPEFVKKNMVKPGAVVIDVGINRVDAPETEKGYKLVGDVAFDEVSEIASFITPVPGGVGPMTIALLLKNTVKAFEIQNA
ncbi:MAG: bifunctional methylenetetrahydrofolate dehydrogenase/methenyltetrahydrofolate cyclohydrolase FolD [Calditrichia bacterium]|nr:bifunctional methylenetetrahydrofolate dehydrogenase/methenyltetrahydrofolate cyclohydrolase FolD [Calditrichota bacterium]MCB0286215.1 bifunctional methylenetetrahydrofolate dehydrogenase/methenyltetrahydrofolate cyclohydrolase FolD [Calditrichota bacterium]MCB9069147.1 bifunctional methylenetetrahydrofolate dehydrogenase/methenyltetrahydrofolate cyclohydrolase FolD [Calditrichia bacterium]